MTEPDTSEETMQLFEDDLYMMNPVDRIDMQIHASIDWDGPVESFVPLNSYMSEMRFEEEAPPETYDYGYVDVCSGGLGGACGLAQRRVFRQLHGASLAAWPRRGPAQRIVGQDLAARGAVRY